MTQRPFAFKHFPQLDGPRAIAILLVISGHVLQFGSGVHNLLGGLSVLLFFVLSGFLITCLLDKEKHSTGSVLLGAFYRAKNPEAVPSALDLSCGIVRSYCD